MGRYEKKHSVVDVGIPVILPILVKKTVITDTESGQQGQGLDWDSYSESDRKAWKNLTKETDE